MRNLFFAIAASLVALPSFAAEGVTVVTPQSMHLDALKEATLTYVVYSHGVPGEGTKRASLNTSKVKRERYNGKDGWTIDQSWENENGISHTAHTVHSAQDLSTLYQQLAWKSPTSDYSTTVVPADGKGAIEGNLPQDRRTSTEAGFSQMKDGWWLNWHSDLTLLPLLPYEKGGILRVHLFDVGMPASKDIDYKVVGSRVLLGGNGDTYDCWLVETDSGRPGTGNFQRFWIDKKRRVVVKEEDVFDGKHRSKYLLSAPVVLEFPQGPSQMGQGT